METPIEQTGLMVKRLQIRHHRAADAALAELGLSLVQWDALRHLHENPGASLHDLAQLTFQTDQSFGALAGRMETRGFIERVHGPGRAIRPRLTPEGERLRAAGATIVRDVLSASFAPLSAPERRAFDALLRKLLAPDPQPGAA